MSESSVYRFGVKRYGRLERWNGQYTDYSYDPDTEVELSILANNQAEALEKAQELSGVYTGPSSNLFNGRETVNHGWVFVVVSATEYDSPQGIV